MKFDVALVVYGVGFAITWFLATAYMIKRFGADDAVELFQAGVWGIAVGLIWPIVWIGGAMSVCAVWTLKQIKARAR